MIHEPSKYQLDIYKHIQHSSSNLMVEAVAGSGKTSTIMEAIPRINPDKSVLLLAFNKHIAVELEERIEASDVTNVEVKTIHSFCMKHLYKAIGGFRVKPNKTVAIMSKLLKMTEAQSKWIPAVKRIVSVAKNINMSPDDLKIHMSAICSDFGICHARTLTSEQVAKIYKACLEDKKQVDFDDMLYYLMQSDVELPHYDYIFVDEAQDLSPIQIELLGRLNDDNNMVVALGDTYQAIYGFRGADATAMKKLGTMLEMEHLPLSICYRCNQDIVKHAQGIVPHIEADGTRDMGGVNKLTMSSDWVDSIQDGSFVLCRTNAPLLLVLFSLYKRGKKAKILGKDYGRNMYKLYNKLKKKNDTISQLVDRVNKWENLELSRYKKKRDFFRRLKITDDAEALKLVIGSCSDVGGVVNKINSIFSDSKAGITLSTIHKAKGMEADYVHIIRPDILPHPKAAEGWQAEQEENMLYVAITRAKKELNYVHKVD